MLNVILLLGGVITKGKVEIERILFRATQGGVAFTVHGSLNFLFYGFIVDHRVIVSLDFRVDSNGEVSGPK